jgi:GNAT superfamily N-acetyltransferase
MDVRILKKAKEKRDACIEITRHLPMWFGLEDSNTQYANDAEKYPALAIMSDKIVVALLVYKKCVDDVLKSNVIDIHWVGVLPNFHRKGLGGKLVEYLQNYAVSQGVGILTVETLDPVANDEHYKKTYAFYQKKGFKIYHRFNYGECNPMIKMRKFLAG